MMFRVGVWMLLAACSAAYEVFDDPRAVMNLYEDNENGYNYNDPYYPDLEQLEMEYAKDLMMHKLLNPAMDDLTMRYGPQTGFMEPQSRFISMPNAELFNLKDAVVKRSPKNPTPAPQQTAVNAAKPVVRKQPKWKAKKVRKVGSQMVCYFKLCAFRPPV